MMYFTASETDGYDQISLDYNSTGWLYVQTDDGKCTIDYAGTDQNFLVGDY